MRRLGAFHGRWRLDVAVVLVPLLVILVLHYVSSRRLARVEEIARRTTLTRYLNEVVADVRQVYEHAADEMLDVPGGVLAGKQFEEIARHFDRADTSAARVLFAGVLDGCLCLTRYYDPATGTIDVGADVNTEAVVLRASTLLRAGTLLPTQERLHLNRADLYVDEADFDNRAVYRFVTDTDSTDADARIVGIVGFVIDSERFEQEYLPRAIAGAMNLLREGVQDNLIVRATDATGRVVTTTHDGSGRADALAARLDFVFRDWELSARSRHTAAAQVLQSNAFTSWGLTVLMSIAVLGGVLLTWRAADRERRVSLIRNAFVASVTHELRTPLASISVFGELLRCGRVTSPDKVVEYGRHIEHESNRLRHFIENVLDFARIQAAEVRYRREPVAVEDVVGAAVSAVDARREGEGFTISVRCPDTLLPVVRVDEREMTRVFVNLLDNAMKYSGRSRQVAVHLLRRDDYVAVSVTDSGIGIAPNDHERIFHQFYRATAPGDVAGTGLGLAIVQQVVHAHEGKVEIDSRLGHGATFTVLIPIADEAADRESASVPAATDGAGFEARAGARADRTRATWAES